MKENTPERPTLYIRFGALPENEQSGVWRNGEKQEALLPGVSVYACTPQPPYQVIVPQFTESTMDTMYGFIAYGRRNRRPVYLVTGTEVGTGPDGEPLLRNVKIVAPP